MDKKLKEILEVLEKLHVMNIEQVLEMHETARKLLTPNVPRETTQLGLVPEVQHDHGVPTEQILEIYHTHCPKLPRVKTFDSSRRAAVCARWRENKQRQTLAYWHKYFRFVTEKCPFLNGDNTSGWKASFDFLMKKANMRKVEENGYIRTRRPA